MPRRQTHSDFNWSTGYVDSNLKNAVTILQIGATPTSHFSATATGSKITILYTQHMGQ